MGRQRLGRHLRLEQPAGVHLLELGLLTALEQDAHPRRVRPEGPDDDALPSRMGSQIVVRIRVIPREDQLGFFVDLQADASSRRRIALTGTWAQSGLFASS